MVIWYHLGKFLRVRWLGHIVYLLLDFRDMSILSSSMVVLDYISTNSELGYLSPQQSHQHVLFFDFCKIVILTWDGWNLIMVFISISLMVEDYFMCLLAMWILSFRKYLFMSFAHFLIVCSFYCWISWSLYRFWIFIQYQLCHLQIFSSIPQVACSLCWMFSLQYRSFLAWCNLIFLVLLLLPILLESFPRSLCLCLHFAEFPHCSAVLIWWY